ncbi:FliM/FliN family flagellar motor switch protein [Roseovarius mucosus]|uniref:FliM/FliN family flagellar motor switch protein n=1 Tax=Roseovarius mucosus TaxID=215743 RepID=UPI003BADBCEB|tara:strand:- start:884 stop:1888 length:1005 start_codon:yes stop_codon:yes gene_type:complete
MAQGMGSQDHSSVIQRMAQAARDGSDSRQMTPVKALRLSLARAADTLFGLGLTVATVEQMRVPLAHVGRSLGDAGLLVLLEGDGGARGALCLDSQFLAGLIEVQTTGSVRPGLARPRAATRTDAAMVAPLIDAVLTEFESQLAQEHDAPPPRRFGFGDMVEDLRGLSLLLVAPDFDLLRLTVDLGPGAKTGRLDLLLPVIASPARASSGKIANTKIEAPANLEQVVNNAPVMLDAVMARLRLPLRDILALKPGDLLPFQRETLNDTQLVGTRGHIVATAELGQMNGLRALRLISGAAAPLPPSIETEPEPVPTEPRRGTDLIPIESQDRPRETI